MEVYLVPIGRGRHALYCEPEEGTPVEVGQHRGIWKRLTGRFAEVLDAVEREHEQRTRPDVDRPSGLWQRLRGRVMAWMAEKIAEQRLLWRLRGRSHVRARYPGSLTSERALSIIRGNLVRDFDRHRWWMAVDLLGGLVGLLLTPIPGPNMLGYYFAFRIVGHFFALRGARHGLTAVRWDLESNVLLEELSDMEHLAPADRTRRVREVADGLGLSRLPRFYHRAAGWTA